MDVMERPPTYHDRTSTIPFRANYNQRGLPRRQVGRGTIPEASWRMVGYAVSGKRRRTSAMRCRYMRMSPGCHTQDPGLRRPRLRRDRQGTSRSYEASKQATREPDFGVGNKVFIVKHCSRNRRKGRAASWSGNIINREGHIRMRNTELLPAF